MAQQIAMATEENTPDAWPLGEELLDNPVLGVLDLRSRAAGRAQRRCCSLSV